MRKIILGILILASCNTKKTDTEVNAGGAGTDSLLSSGCYQMIIEKDSARMELLLNGKTVSGQLDYKRFEKDNNTGTLTGTIDSNKLIAWYKFQSEGMISVRQVIFKINGNTLLEAFGDIGAKGDTAYFKYPHNLNYEENHPYTKVDCK